MTDAPDEDADRASDTEADARASEQAADPAVPSSAPTGALVATTARRIDSQPLLLRLAGRLRRTLPGDDRFGDPLSVAGSTPAEVVGRQVQVRSSARPSVAREIGLGALQVWQALSESAGRGRGDREVAMLFTDLVGFSSWALNAGDEAAVTLLREVGIAVEGAVADRRGTTVKRLGDGLMAVFSRPQDAVDAALAAQEAIAGIEVAGHRPRLRAGVHVGRPRKLGGDYLGVDVNIAARVADQANAGQVLVSDVVAERIDVQRLKVGRRRKLRASGAPRDMRVCEVKAIRDPDRA